MWSIYKISSIFTLFFTLNHHVYSYDIMDTGDAMQYLSRFGYIGKDTASSMNIVDAGSVLKQFQHMAGIPETGVLDNATMNMMNTPRCGNKDMEVEMIPDKDEEDDVISNLVRRKRYKLNENRAMWKKRDLTYHLGQFSPMTKVSPELIERDVAQAFKLWSAATNLNFIRTKDKNADIQLGFTPTRHQDNFPFDGPGKTLAHAFPPGPALGGDVHFDEHEEWTVDSPKGTNVLFVAVHEIGHSLGLSHSDAKGAIMQAFYGGYRPHLKLHEDDVAGIQALYGTRNSAPAAPSIPQDEPVTTRSSFPRFSPTHAPPRWPEVRVPTWRPMDETRFDKTTPPPESPTRTSTVRTSLFSGHRTVTRIPVRMAMDPTTATTTTARSVTPYPTNHPATPGFRRPDLCKEGIKVDAITAMKDGFIYVFSGFYVFQIGTKGEGVSPGWPSRIEYKFKGLEGNIEAAFTRPNGKTFFFKGGKYWRFTGLEPDKGYPKSISKHFPGIPDHVDAAFENKHNGQMYFIKGNKFWRFDPLYKSGQHVSDIYPLPTSIWKLDEPDLDAALSTAEGDIYFLKGDKLYRFEEKNFELAKGEPAYPHSARTKLYGCGKESDAGPSPISARITFPENYYWRTNGEGIIVPRSSF